MKNFEEESKDIVSNNNKVVFTFLYHFATIRG